MPPLTELHSCIKPFGSVMSNDSLVELSLIIKFLHNEILNLTQRSSEFLGVVSNTTVG
jgi:hypothetical protein